MTFSLCSNYSGPLKAFFMGLDGKESVAYHLDRWDREQWSSGEAQQKYADYKIQVDKAHKALRLIKEDRLESYTGSLAYAAIKGDPAIATAVMQAMDDHGERAGALQNVHGLDSNHVIDVFPAPGLPNRLPNFQERYECLLEAGEAGNFPAGQRRSLLSSLYTRTSGTGCPRRGRRMRRCQTNGEAMTNLLPPASGRGNPTTRTRRG